MKKALISIIILLSAAVTAKFTVFQPDSAPSAAHSKKKSSKSKKGDKLVSGSQDAKNSKAAKASKDNPLGLVLLPEPKAKKLTAPTSFSPTSITPEQACDAAFADALKSELTKTLSSVSTAKDVATLLAKDKALRLKFLQYQLLSTASSTEKELQTRRKKQQEALSKEETKLATAKELPTMPFELMTMEKNIAQMQAQVALPVRFSELFENKNQAAIFQAMSGDLSFLEQMFYSGDPIPVVRAFTIFAELAEHEPDVLTEGRLRDIALAISLEYARFDWQASTGVERGLFFLKNYQAKRFHKVMDSIPMSVMRLLVGNKGNNNTMSVTSMQLGLDTAHMPQAYYVGFKGQTAICWRCGWRRNNLLGDSIHANYYETYSQFYGDNEALRTLEVGGVCGAVSSFGACCAVANGIPAMTMGEPGHCAYTVLVDGKWTPAYSLSWKRSLHWQPWQGVGFFSALQLAYDLDDGPQAAKTQKALELAATARLMSTTDAAMCCELYNLAIETQPLAYPIYRDYLSYLDKNPMGNAAAIMLKEMCQTLTKKYPEMAAFILQQHGMPMLKDANLNVRSTIVTDFWKACDGPGIAPWDMTAYLGKQAEWIGKAGGNADDNIVAFYGKLLAAVITKPELTPSAMAWANTWSQTRDKATQAKLADASLKVLKAAANKGISMDVMLGKVILSAEGMDDLDSFRTLSEMVDKNQRYTGKMPTFEAFSGELLSEKGMIRLSTSDEKHDTPLKHAGVLHPEGGTFHTTKEKDAYVVVQLPRVSELSGIVIVLTSNQAARQKNMKVQISETGADGTWEDLHDFGDATPARVLRQDLSKKKARGRFVRILRQGGPEYFHLNGIYIYGKLSS